MCIKPHWHKLSQRGLEIEYERPILAVFGEIKFECGFRADIIVRNKIIIACKSLESLAPVHGKKLLTYLRG